MPTGNSLYQRKPGRLAEEKKKFRTLVEKLGKLTSKQGYTKKQIASELGVSLTTVYQWSTGYTLTARQETIERLKKFLSYHAYEASAAIRRAYAGFVGERAFSSVDCCPTRQRVKSIVYVYSRMFTRRDCEEHDQINPMVFLYGTCLE